MNGKNGFISIFCILFFVSTAFGEKYDGIKVTNKCEESITVYLLTASREVVEMKLKRNSSDEYTPDQEEKFYGIKIRLDETEKSYDVKEGTEIKLHLGKALGFGLTTEEESELNLLKIVVKKSRGKIVIRGEDGKKIKWLRSI